MSISRFCRKRRPSIVALLLRPTLKSLLIGFYWFFRVKNKGSLSVSHMKKKNTFSHTKKVGLNKVLCQNHTQMRWIIKIALEFGNKRFFTQKHFKFCFKFKILLRYLKKSWFFCVKMCMSKYSVWFWHISFYQLFMCENFFFFYFRKVYCKTTYLLPGAKLK